MSEDKCRPVEVDGETIRVLVAGREAMDATDREMFADVVRAAKRKWLAELKPAKRPTDESTILLDSLRGYGYSESDIIHAIVHPDYWAEELIQAKADLTGRAAS